MSDEERSHARKSDTFWFKIAPIVYGLIGSLIGPLIFIGVYRERIETLIRDRANDNVRQYAMEASLRDNEKKIIIIETTMLGMTDDVKTIKNSIHKIELIMAAQGRIRVERFDK